MIVISNNGTYLLDAAVEEAHVLASGAGVPFSLQIDKAKLEILETLFHSSLALV